jgi:hypothetical protein
MNSRTVIFLFACAAALGGMLAWQLSLPANDVVELAPVARAAPAGAVLPRLTQVQPRWSSSAPQANAPRPNHAIYGRNGRVVDLGGLDVAHYIASRMSAARRGDVKAAYEVYQAVSICAANQDPVAEYHDPAERAQFLAERADQVKLCAGLSPAQVQERLAFLDTAARAGHVGAQIDYYMEGPYGRDFDIAENPGDPTVTQWKSDALTYLQQAGNKCDQFALALLSTVYDAGQLTERDLGASMAYSIAAAVPRKKPLTEAQLRERFGEELSAAQFTSAQQRGAALASEACAK